MWQLMRVLLYCCCSVTNLYLTLRPHGRQAHQASLSFIISQSFSNSYPLSGWCLPTISSSVIPFSSCAQFFPTLGSFPMIWFFTSGVRRIGTSVSASVLPMNIQDWFPLGLTGLISLLSKGLSRDSFMVK